jgi:hypothetical protein
MQKQADPFKYAVQPIVEKPVPEQAVSKPSTDAPSSSGVKQLVRSFEDLSPSRETHDDWILDNPYLFRPGVMDEVAERMGVKLKPGMKKKGGEEKASFIKQKLAERRGKGEARTKNLGI